VCQGIDFLEPAEKLLWKLNGGESCSLKESLHSEVRNSLLFRCKAYTGRYKNARNPNLLK
jgi:hypothetical protein